MKRNLIYENYSPSEYYDAVFNGAENNSELVYYLLKRRLSKSLAAVYKTHGFGLSDEYEDTVDDFFLYLYDWGWEEGKRPFAMLESIHTKQAFFGWVLGTYRNFLLNKAKEEAKRRESLEHARIFQRDDNGTLSDETMIQYLTTAIAYADQQFMPRNRFLFYRMLMTFLDREKAIPQDVMAEIMAMHPVTYRVCTKRQKERLLKFITLQERGETMALDEKHLVIRDQLIQHFDDLYNALMELYEKSIDLLSMADDIQVLRMSFGGDSMVHESLSPYGFGIARLYPKLKDFLSKS